MLTMATMEQKIYLIGGQKVISAGISQNYRALRRKVFFGPTRVLRALFRMILHFITRDRAAGQLLPASSRTTAAAGRS